MSFPPGTEMFQFPGFASAAYGFSDGYPLRGGLPHSEILGINACSRLPRAFRSVPRPSSPLGAKASTRCPCFPRPHQRQQHPTEPRRLGGDPAPCAHSAHEERSPRMQIAGSRADQSVNPTKSIPMLLATVPEDGKTKKRARQRLPAPVRHDCTWSQKLADAPDGLIITTIRCKKEHPSDHPRPCRGSDGRWKDGVLSREAGPARTAPGHEHLPSCTCTRAHGDEGRLGGPGPT